MKSMNKFDFEFSDELPGAADTAMEKVAEVDPVPEINVETIVEESTVNASVPEDVTGPTTGLEKSAEAIAKNAEGVLEAAGDASTCCRCSFPSTSSFGTYVRECDLSDALECACDAKSDLADLEEEQEDVDEAIVTLTEKVSNNTSLLTTLEERSQYLFELTETGVNVTVGEGDGDILPAESKALTININSGCCSTTQEPDGPVGGPEDETPEECLSASNVVQQKYLYNFMTSYPMGKCQSDIFYLMAPLNEEGDDVADYHAYVEDDFQGEFAQGIAAVRESFFYSNNDFNFMTQWWARNDIAESLGVGGTQLVIGENMCLSWVNFAEEGEEPFNYNDDEIRVQYTECITPDDLIEDNSDEKVQEAIQ